MLLFILHFSGLIPKLPLVATRNSSFVMSRKFPESVCLSFLLMSRSASRSILRIAVHFLSYFWTRKRGLSWNNVCQQFSVVRTPISPTRQVLPVSNERRYLEKWAPECYLGLDQMSSPLRLEDGKLEKLATCVLLFLHDD